MKKERDVFISYHTDSAKDIVIKIGDRLDQNGVSCWYAPRDCDGNFDEAIMQGLNRASLFLLIINEGSMRSEHVKNEIHAAFERFKVHSMVPLLFQIDDHPVNDTVQYYFGRIHRINALNPPLDKRIDELVSRIVQIKSDLSMGAPEYVGGETRIISVNITPADDFVGREREQAEIFDFVKANKKIFVSGMGGIGKSGLMRNFAVKYRNKFRTISWATYDSGLKNAVISDANIRIAGFKPLGANEDGDAYFARKYEFLMEYGVEDDLIIIDNYDAQSDPDFEKIMALPVSIIFTTRTAQGNNYTLDRIESDDELYELFKKGYPRQVDAEGKKTIYEIIRLLEGHTLAIRLISVYMRDKRLRPNDILAKLKSDTFALLDGIEGGQARAGHIVSGMFSIDDLSEAQRNVMYNLTFIPVSGIEAMDFYDMCKLSDYDAIDGLIERNWIQHNAATDYISLHPLIRDMCLARIPFDDTASAPFIHSLTKENYYNSRRYNYEKKMWLLSVTERVLNIIPKTSELYDDFMIGVGRLFHILSLYNRIIDIFTEFEAECRSPRHKLYACLETATAYRCNGVTEGLGIYLEKAWEMFRLCEQDLPERERAWAESELCSVEGWYYIFIREYDKSLVSNRKKLDIDLKMFSDDDIQVAWAYFYYATSEMNMKRFDNAIADFNKALELFNTADFPFGAGCCNNSMSLLYHTINKPEEVLRCAAESVRLLTDAVGEVQADTGFAYKMMAFAYKTLGNFDEAEKNIAKALDIAHKLRLSIHEKNWRDEYLAISRPKR